jgi:hypothetical protein
MSKIWTKEDIEKIFEDIQQFAIEIERSTFCKTEEVDEKQKVYVFIGDKAYPQNRAVSPSIILPFAFYSNLKFSEVAFLSNSRTLELYSILGILLDSLDGAAQLIDLLLQNSLMDVFAKYLWYRKRVLLVNATNQKTQIDAFLKQYSNYNVFLCCGQSHTLKSFATLNQSRSKHYKHFNFMVVNHPSPRAYQTGFDSTCRCYMERTYADRLSNLTIQDFSFF